MDLGNIEGKLKKPYYNPAVKPYDPMSCDPLCDGGSVNKNDYKFFAGLSSRRLNYNPISIQNEIYQPEYQIKKTGIGEKNIRSANRLFKKKENKVFTYKPITTDPKINTWSYSVSKKVFEGGSRFFKVFKNVVQTFNQWFKKLTG